MTSLKPFCRAKNWASMPWRKRQFTYSLWKNQLITQEIHLIPSEQNSVKQKSKTGTASVPDILLLGLLSHRDALPVGLEFMGDYFSIGVVLHAECVIQNSSDVVSSEQRGGAERRYSIWHFIQVSVLKINAKTDRKERNDQHHLTGSGIFVFKFYVFVERKVESSVIKFFSSGGKNPVYSMTFILFTLQVYFKYDIIAFLSFLFL